MTTPLYAIGDVHGCLPSLKRLMERIPRDARLIFLGDTINRGPESLATLRYIRSLGERATILLGNHEFHLLATWVTGRRQHRRDTLQDILEAKDAKDLIKWIRTWKLAHREDGFLFVHAGLAPQWTADEAMALAAEFEDQLQHKGWKAFFRDMYGDTQWDPSLTGLDRTRAVVNAFTRIRNVHADGTLNHEGFVRPDPATGDMPWFEYPSRRSADTTVVFGHWSVLGLVNRPNVIAMDMGCLWGGTLAAMRLPERELVIDQCPPYRLPG